MTQMSLTGEIPLTHTNVLQAVRDEGPITEFDLLRLLGHEINVRELEALDEVVRELRDRKTAVAWLRDEPEGFACRGCFGSSSFSQALALRRRP